MPDTLPGLRHVEHVMGTVFSFDIRDAPTPAVAHALQDAVAWLHRVDEVFSTYRPDSQISRLDRGETDAADCDPDVAEVLRLCASVEQVSGGWFSRTPGGSLDPSGLVKGWAIERASSILERAGARNTCVNGGPPASRSTGPSPTSAQRPPLLWVGHADLRHRSRYHMTSIRRSRSPAALSALQL